MLLEGTQLEKRDASPANFARLLAQHMPSLLRASPDQMVQEGLPNTTSTSLNVSSVDSVLKHALSTPSLRYLKPFLNQLSIGP
jgi:hypothetical protein